MTLDDDRDWDDEYDPTEYGFEITAPPETVSRRFSCLACRGGLIVALMPRMITGTACSCGQAFMFNDGADDHVWRGPTHNGPTTALFDKPRPNHVRDAVNANR